LLSGIDKLATAPPQNAPFTEIQALKFKLYNTLQEIRAGNSKLTVHDLRRLLFRCAATLISLERVSAFPWNPFILS
jgi:phosphatidylinositol 4-kinase